jgi:hypothetical protein
VSVIGQRPREMSGQLAQSAKHMDVTDALDVRLRVVAVVLVLPQNARHHRRHETCRSSSAHHARKRGAG